MSIADLGITGVAAMIAMPGYPATDYITAAAVGIVNGLAHQSGVQAADRGRII